MRRRLPTQHARGILAQFVSVSVTIAGKFAPRFRSPLTVIRLFDSRNVSDGTLSCSRVVEYNCHATEEGYQEGREVVEASQEGQAWLGRQGQEEGA